jgi:hypothetical protein
MDLSGGLLADVPFAPALSRDELRKISNPTMTDRQKELNDLLKTPWSADWQQKEDYFSMQEMTALAERKAFGHGTAAKKFETFNSLYQAYQQQAAQGIAVEQAELKQVQQTLSIMASLYQFISQNHQKQPQPKKEPPPPTASAAPSTAGSAPEFSRDSIDQIRKQLSGQSTPGRGASLGSESLTPFWDMMTTGEVPTAGTGLITTGSEEPVSPNMPKGLMGKIKDILRNNAGRLGADAVAVIKAFADFAVTNAERHFTERGSDIAAYVNRESTANSIYAGIEQNKQQLTQQFGGLISRSAQYVATWVRWNKMSELNMLFGSILGVDGLNFSPWNPQMLVDAMIDASITGRADKYELDDKGHARVKRSGFQHFIGQYGEQGAMYKPLRQFLEAVGPAYANAMSMYKKSEDPKRNDIFGPWDASEKGKSQHADIAPDQVLSVLQGILDNAGGPDDGSLPNPADVFKQEGLFGKSGSRQTEAGFTDAFETAIRATPVDDITSFMYGLFTGEEEKK